MLIILDDHSANNFLGQFGHYYVLSLCIYQMLSSILVRTLHTMNEMVEKNNIIVKVLLLCTCHAID